MNTLAHELRMVADGEAGAVARVAVYPDDTTSEAVLAAWTQGKFGGTPVPDWVGQAAYVGGVTTHTAADARVWPAYGAVANGRGEVFRSTMGEVLTSGISVADLERDAPAEQLGAVAVYLPFGARFNYGHFLLDGLTSLQAIADAGLLEGRLALSDRLGGWHRELVELAFPEVPRHETAAVMVAAESAVFADSMDHYLHRPGPAALRLRERMLDRLAPPEPSPERIPERIYVSRRGSNMRLLVNEAALERALAARGFTIVHPEALSVRAQIDLFRGARVILGATGAGLANALFAGGEACVIEILPGNFSAGWLRDLCFRVGCEWRGWFAPSPLAGWQAWPYRRRPGLRFAWRLRLRPFLAWLDRELAGLGQSASRKSGTRFCD